MYLELWGKEVESSPSDDKRSGSNESSRRSYLLEISPCVAFLTSLLTAQTSQRTAVRDQFSIQALAMGCRLSC